MAASEDNRIFNICNVPLLFIIAQGCLMFNEHRCWNGRSLIGITMYITELSVYHYLFIFSAFFIITIFIGTGQRKRHLIVDICYWGLLVLYAGTSYAAEFSLFGKTPPALASTYLQFTRFISIYPQGSLINQSLVIFSAGMLIKSLAVSPLLKKKKSSPGRKNQ